MSDYEIEIPNYFICPISLQIMRDPVTAITGITYDRESIENWLFTTKNTNCPVTNQPLPEDSDLTPNHTLRRLIQAWCTAHGIDRIPTPKPCIDKFYVVKLLQELSNRDERIGTLKKLELLALENERNKKYMVEAGVPEAMLSVVVECFSENRFDGLEEALSLLKLIKIPTSESKLVVQENGKVVDSLTWVLGCKIDNHGVKSNAALALKSLLKEANSSVLERLKPEFFEGIVSVLRSRSVMTQAAINAALNILFSTCPWGRNRQLMVEYGAVFDLIEIELGAPERRTTELVLGILFHLCSCASGRAEFLNHRGSIAVVAKRILTVSPVADDMAILILGLICKHCSGSEFVVQEMLSVKAVSKMCMVVQADSPKYLKSKAMEILGLHYNEWKDSPCIDGSLLASFAS